MSAAAQIRIATIIDSALLETLHRDSCRADWDEAWSLRSFADILSMPGAIGLVAVLDNAPAAFALGRVAADESEVLLIATHPMRRRQGIGRALLRDLLQRLANAGAMRVFLEVAAPNMPALELYEAAGFRKVGRRPNYYRPVIGKSGVGKSGVGQSGASQSGESAIDAVLLSRDLHDFSA